MSKHHHQGKAEQLYNKARGAGPFNFKKRPDLRREARELVDLQARMSAGDNSSQLWNYQISGKKEESALDNWQEIDQTLRKKG